MFKTGKQKGNNYIVEQQSQMNQLNNYISARFGEDIADSNIVTKLNNIEKNLKEIQTNYRTTLEKTTKKLKKQIEDESKKVATELNDSQTESYFKLLQKNENDFAKIKKIVDERKEIDEKVLQLDKFIKEQIKTSELYQQKIQKELKETNQKIGKINYLGISSKFDKKLKEECSIIEDKVEEVKKQTEAEIAKNAENIANLAHSFDKRLSKENETENNNIQNFENKLSELEKKLLEKIETLNLNIQVAENKTQELEENLTNRFATIDNQVATSKLEENMQKGLEQVKQETKESINKFKKSTEEKNIKIKEELNEQIINSYNENKTELENIALAVDIIKNTMEASIENIGQEVLKLKNETNTNLEKQGNSVADIELLKKDYNKYVTKMNNELAKISKAILDAQKKNLETNQSLQVKIKSYIDSKIEKADNTKKIEELINNLNLSIQERERLQKLEMEELLNKKLKAIQKENERILNKKIEEISSKFIRDNSTYIRTKQNNVTLYQDPPTKKKNVYELIDENQILKRSASSKNPLSTSQEGKSQILKFFYDDEE